MLDEGCLDLRCGESVPGNVDNIVHAASDPVIAFMIPASTVTSELRHVSRIKSRSNHADSHNSPCIR